MKRTPSALKWLAEKRGQLAHDLQHTQRIRQELTERCQRLETQMAGLDETIRLFDPSLQPEKIEPVRAWQGRYGKRGALRQALLRILHAHGTEWVDADNIEALLIVEFGLDFQTPSERSAWRKNGLGCGLRGLAAEGLAERLDDPETRTGKSGHWRLKRSSASSLADL